MHLGPIDEMEAQRKLNENITEMLENVIEFSSEGQRRAWMGEPIEPPAPPKPDPTITPTRRNDFGVFEFVGVFILSVIDWLNGLTGAEKPKQKTNGEQMQTLDELFEGYEDVERFRDTPYWDSPEILKQRIDVPGPPPPPPLPSPPCRDVTRRY